MDDSRLVIFNAHHKSVDWVLPTHWQGAWLPQLCTAPDDAAPQRERQARETFTAPIRSVTVFLQHMDNPESQGT